ncbi:MAG: hypothetical protein M1827_002470 [Pycnora praestabilis]|nr:MAG: hypothetical protein M1827_002470 [Pycnora praestabilis]
MSSRQEEESSHVPESIDARDEDTPPAAARFSPEEESALLNESNEQKAHANKLFSSSKYSDAISQYDKALSSLPNYLEYEIAVLKSNISACHLKLEDWKAAIEAATQSVEALDRLDPPKKKEEEGKEEEKKDGRESDRITEVTDEEEKDIKAGRSREDRQRIRAKALMRRARARSEVGGWAALQGADEDYRELSSMPIPPQDRKIVQRELSTLPSRLEEAKQKDMAEMMSKLKGLGNSILKPFGLSTDNFNMVKDEASGGYSMNFNQGR